MDTLTRPATVSPAVRRALDAQRARGWARLADRDDWTLGDRVAADRIRLTVAGGASVTVGTLARSA